MDNVVPIRKKQRSSGKSILLSLLVTVIAGALYYYLKLPALNPKSGDLYAFILLLCVVYTLATLVFSGGRLRQQAGDYAQFVRSRCKLPLAIAILTAAVIVVGWLSSAVFFRAESYAQLLTPTDSSFSDDVDQISFDQIPMLDKDAAERLGDRKLGELSDMVSQFEVSSAYAQINYQGRPVRVTYLEYADFFKWLSNRSEGLPAYIYIDMVTQEANVVRLDEGMKYSPAEYFNRYLYRHLRFQYPTLIFDDCNFEIDEQGHPWWICSVLDRTIGLFGGSDVKGAVLVDAVTGESRYLPVDEIPSWVDRVYSADLLVQQYDYHGLYQGAFWNSLYGQKGCTMTTEGYNYIAQSDDVWLYTGITSVTTDASNIGFILVNQRTKEARYYPVAGATEYSAMSSAEGVVQHLKYRATFPLLLNISGEPTYFISLKDDASLVKMYAMVNVEQYQIVATGSTVAECEQSYIALLRQNGIAAESSVPGGTAAATVTGRIEELRSAVIDGTTCYYLRIEGVWYRVSAAECEAVVLCSRGDTVTLATRPGDGEEIIPATLSDGE